MHSSPSRSLSCGLSLPELLVTLALVAALVLAGLPAMADQRLRQQASRQGWQLQADVLLAQSLALSQGRAVRWAWLPASAASTAAASSPGSTTLSCWALLLGTSTGCRCPVPSTVQGEVLATCPSGTTVLLTHALAPPWSLGPTAASVLFDPVRGTATPTASLALQLDGVVWLKHIINISGRVRSCSDQGVAGWPPCSA
ncbi:prepilin-type N-terminal cleavage/methylation domain-containing protein [Amphibiibacter pelophylacis]|uniref:Prepilin-type N-terminal cleavage/methylation domain-containing protein n=1 Tax=Amphibiibacter pelophylacis TaxID=1799477 RepID=A0ACC6P3M9_9BURK